MTCLMRSSHVSQQSAHEDKHMRSGNIEKKILWHRYRDSISNTTPRCIADAVVQRFKSRLHLLSATPLNFELNRTTKTVREYLRKNS